MGRRKSQGGRKSGRSGVWRRPDDYQVQVTLHDYTTKPRQPQKKATSRGDDRLLYVKNPTPLSGGLPGLGKRR
jgi:hypothetical protein